MKYNETVHFVYVLIRLLAIALGQKNRQDGSKKYEKTEKLAIHFILPHGHLSYEDGTGLISGKWNRRWKEKMLNEEKKSDDTRKIQKNKFQINLK